MEELKQEVAQEHNEEKLSQEEDLKSNIEKNIENENSQEVSEKPVEETTEIKPEDANTTNCLALTIQKDHKIIAIKNVFLRSIRMSWKVVVSAVTLALIKLFS